MHGTSITCRSFPTSLENHRNKPHLTWSPDAPGIISNVFTPELFVVLADGPSFFADYPLVPVFIPGGLFTEFVGCPPNSRTVRCIIAAQLKFIKFIEDAFEMVKQVLLCYLGYFLSSKHKFNTKKVYFNFD